jgi:stringent starvation protein B
MENFYEQLLENDLNPYLLFDSNGKIKSYNKEAEFLLNFVNVKELFELAVSNASLNFGFNHKYINLKYNKLSFYAILVGYATEDEIALRLYKSVSNENTTINDEKLKLVNIYSLIDLSKNSTLLSSNLQIEELYDISIPDMKINVNDFLLCLNDCFLMFANDEKVTLQVHIKTGEYEIINKKRHKIALIEFIADKKIESSFELEKKAKNANANLFISQNRLKLEVPVIL